MTQDMPATADRASFARIAGYKRGYITQLGKDGRLVFDAEGAILVAESLARIRETADPSKAGVAARHEAERSAKTRPVEDSEEGQEPAEPANASTASYQASRALKEHYGALAAQREYEISIGKLLDAEQVAGVIADAVTAIRVRLEALADLLAAQLAAEPDEGRCRALIAEAHHEALADLARSFRKAVPAAQK